MIIIVYIHLWTYLHIHTYTYIHIYIRVNPCMTCTVLVVKKMLDPSFEQQTSDFEQRFRMPIERSERSGSSEARKHGRYDVLIAREARKHNRYDVLRAARAREASERPEHAEAPTGI